MEKRNSDNLGPIHFFLFSLFDHVFVFKKKNLRNLKPTLSLPVYLRELGNGLALESLSNKMEIKCHGEEREEQQPPEAQDQSKLWLLKDRNLAREKEQERRRREAVSTLTS